MVPSRRPQNLVSIVDVSENRRSQPCLESRTSAHALTSPDRHQSLSTPGSIYDQFSQTFQGNGPSTKSAWSIYQEELSKLEKALRSLPNLSSLTIIPPKDNRSMLLRQFYRRFLGIIPTRCAKLQRCELDSFHPSQSPRPGCKISVTIIPVMPSQSLHA